MLQYDLPLREGALSEQSTYLIIGVMSGTSLDGLDLAAVEFSRNRKNWCFEVLRAETIAYTPDLVYALKQAIDQQNDALNLLDKRLGQFIGAKIASFSADLPRQPDFIASHGHTIRHQPDQGLTLQIGDARSIQKKSKLPVINNFRQRDVSLGGQGAPLVPIGDRDLFGEYDFCLNLGGIANISFEKNETRTAFDICPFNMVINELAGKLGMKFDNGGQIAATGKTDPLLFEELNAVPYLRRPWPKSLGLEDYRKLWQPLLNRQGISPKDKLRTFTEHTALQIAEALPDESNGGNILVTGGGTFNTFFLSRLAKLSNKSLIVPDNTIINYKEAIIFAYLGLLRYLNLNNCLASVTGAAEDSSGGDLYGFF